MQLATMDRGLLLALLRSVSERARAGEGLVAVSSLEQRALDEAARALAVPEPGPEGVLGIDLTGPHPVACLREGSALMPVPLPEVPPAGLSPDTLARTVERFELELGPAYCALPWGWVFTHSGRKPWRRVLADLRPHDHAGARPAAVVAWSLRGAHPHPNLWLVPSADETAVSAAFVRSGAGEASPTHIRWGPEGEVPDDPAALLDLLERVASPPFGWILGPSLPPCRDSRVVSVSQDLPLPGLAPLECWRYAASAGATTLEHVEDRGLVRLDALKGC